MNIKNNTGGKWYEFYFWIISLCKRRLYYRIFRESYWPDLQSEVTHAGHTGLCELASLAPLPREWSFLTDRVIVPWGPLLGKIYFV